MKQIVVIASLIVSICAQNGVTPDWQPKFLGQTNLRHAAFLAIYQSEDTSLEYEDRFSMYVSTFDPALVGVTDDVWYMRSMGRYLDDVDNWKQNNLEVLDKSSLWPNNMDYVPSQVAGAGSHEGIIQTSGFLVFGKTDGQLQYYDTTVEPPAGPINIASSDTEDWSYHRVIWMDMDNDGDLDAVTARFRFLSDGDINTEFMWFENENIGMIEGWTEHVVSTSGPDISFYPVTQTVNGRTYDCIVFGEFFKARSTIYWTESEVGDWSDTSLVSSRVILETGNVFDVLVDDFNQDGVQEFVATEYTPEENNGLVRAYFFPSDFRVDPFEHTIIANGFQAPVSSTFGQYMTPGTPITFYPNTAYAQELSDDGFHHKPWILLSGDDNGCFYIITPDTETKSDWSYTTNELLNTTGQTVGKMDHADLDGDGYEEIVLAGFSTGELYVFSYSP